MRRCLELAERGRGIVSPNPMVGAVIVHQGKIIGEGWHERYGQAHAEVNAIRRVRNKNQLWDSTLYVNLEPCSHFGKTPPCADLIIEKKIPRVVVGAVDPYPAVSGNGVRLLRKAGVSVRVGMLQAESEKLNEGFLTTHAAGRPFVALKVAQTLDGKIATRTGESKWITGEAARAYAHRLRSQHDAILIGTGTAMADNPSLTVRAVAGQNPVRLVLDRGLRIAASAKIFNAEARTILFTSTSQAQSEKAAAQLKRLRKKNIQIEFITESGTPDGRLDLREVLAVVHREKLLSVLVEGGAALHAALIQAELCDKLYAFIAPKLIGDTGLGGIADLGITQIAQAVSLSNLTLGVLADTILVEGYFAAEDARR